jgi:uncharacterized protein
MMSSRRVNRKYRRLFFSTDLHASDVSFRKFIGAAKFYDIDTLVMGGDVTGKTVVPIVEASNGRYHFNFQGQEFTDVPADGLSDYDTRISNSGLYPTQVSESEYENLMSNPENVSALFETLMTSA